MKIFRKGRGRIFSLCGDAGTGKSRLIEEFKNSLDLKEIQWIEGHAYAYSQNIPYFPLIDLLNRVFQIEEGDPPEKVKRKNRIRDRTTRREERIIVPFVGSLYSLHYPEVEDVSPEFWKSRLQEVIQTILSGLAKQRSNDLLYWRTFTGLIHPLWNFSAKPCCRSGNLPLSYVSIDPRSVFSRLIS